MKTILIGVALLTLIFASSFSFAAPGEYIDIQTPEGTTSCFDYGGGFIECD